MTKTLTRRFFTEVLRSAFYNDEENLVNVGLLNEGEDFAYKLLDYYFERCNQLPPYIKSDFTVEWGTVSEVMIVRVTLHEATAGCMRLYMMFRMSDKIPFYGRACYFATEDSDGDIQCEHIGSDGGTEACPLLLEDMEDDITEWMLQDYQRRYKKCMTDNDWQVD